MLTILAEESTTVVRVLEDLDLVTQGTRRTEAFARTAINLVLVTCLAEEKRLALHTTTTSTEAATQPSPSAEGDALDSRLSLQFETKLLCPVKFHNQERILRGQADYALWYDAADPMSTNLVIVEAKKRGRLSTAEAQVVAYMGKSFPTKLRLSTWLAFRC